MDDLATYPPFVFESTGHAPGYALRLHDGHMAAADAVFAAAGWSSGGHGWEGVARFLLDSGATTGGGPVSFDSEAGMFACYSADPVALDRLAALLQTLHRDHAALARLLAQANDARTG
ncbi:Imm51 family immunity protein [Nocardiopsis sediminis]|uniref:Imm51 family immunity protein n=1 Tax=Nocardiopsis sediminis TaxID=1778267 RepID=A0ABV8FR19_9ACTN